jgi:hypothetical protein
MKVCDDQVFGDSVHEQSGGTHERVEQTRHAFQRSPNGAICEASCTTLRRVLHNRLHLFALKMRIIQELKPDDKSRDGTSLLIRFIASTWI